jgi:hypothetical protein
MCAAILAACVVAERAVPVLLAPRALTFPHLKALSCPGEACIVGRWLACDSVPLFDSPEARQPATQWYVAGDRFDVTAGAVLVVRPGAVQVTRTLQQATPGGGARAYGGRGAVPSSRRPRSS